MRFSSTLHDPVPSQTTHPAPQEGELLSGLPPPGLAIASLIHAEAERQATPQTGHALGRVLTFHNHTFSPQPFRNSVLLFFLLPPAVFSYNLFPAIQTSKKISASKTQFLPVVRMSNTAVTGKDTNNGHSNPLLASTTWRMITLSDKNYLEEGASKEATILNNNSAHTHTHTRTHAHTFTPVFVKTSEIHLQFRHVIRCQILIANTRERERETENEGERLPALNDDYSSPFIVLSAAPYLHLATANQQRRSMASVEIRIHRKSLLSRRRTNRT